MFLSMVLGEILSLASLASTGGRLGSAHAASPLSATTVLTAILDPAALALEVAAIVLVIVGSRELSGGSRVRRAAMAAAALFALWAVLNLGVYLPLVTAGMREGSLGLVRLGLWVKVAAASLQYLVPFLLVHGLARGRVRGCLYLALALTVVGGLGTIALPIANVRLVEVMTPGGRMYVPRYEVDYTAWPYPALLALSHAGGVLYMLAYAVTAAGLRDSA